MHNIFLSRPTWLPDNYRPGLDAFCRVLRTLGVEPRTLGETDYPCKAPLDDVISLMQQCSGAIILGYPQIWMTAGRVKTQVVSDVVLATEWNQIEAALAYARNLPLLIVHHVGVGRGVFDRGAINSFIYEADLAEPSWALSSPVQGALRTWLGRITAAGDSSGSRVFDAL